MTPANFAAMSDVQEFTDIEASGSDSKSNNNNNPVVISEVQPLTSGDENLQDMPSPLSLNPLDWYRDIKKEFQEFTWAMTEKKRVVRRRDEGKRE